MKKKVYIAPCVKKQVSLQMEGSLLTGSVVNKSTKVETKGQEVVPYDFTETQFNQSWE